MDTQIRVSVIYGYFTTKVPAITRPTIQQLMYILPCLVLPVSSPQSEVFLGGNTSNVVVVPFFFCTFPEITLPLLFFDPKHFSLSFNSLRTCSPPFSGADGLKLQSISRLVAVKITV